MSYSGDGGKATSATINNIQRLHGDSSGKLYFSEQGSQRVRVISTASIISTFMGTGSSSYAGEDVPATSAGLTNPAAMVIDASNGDFYLSVYGAYRVYVVTATTSKTTTFVGTGTSSASGNSGAATSTALSGPEGLYLVQGSGQMYLVDNGASKVKLVYSSSPTASPTAVPSVSVSPTAIPTSVRSSMNNIRHFAGTGNTGSSTGTDGPASDADFNDMRSIWFDSVGNAYISENSGGCVRTVDTAGIVHEYAGVCGNSGFNGDDGASTSIQMSGAISIFVSSVGNLYIADIGNDRVRMASTDGIMSTVAGTGDEENTGDGGPASSAGVFVPHGLWGNSVGVLYISSYSGHVVRAVNSAGIITTFAGLHSYII